MAKVIIKSIAKQSIMSNEDFEYIKDNIGKPLPVLSISFWRARPSVVSTLAVYTPDSCITLFPEEQGIVFEMDFGVVNND